MVQLLPHVNATLNCIAASLLIAGILFIRRGRERAHRRAMISAFAVSVAFLISYLIYHSMTKHRPLGEQAPQLFRIGYYGMLLSHIVLAAIVPVLAIITIYLGLKDRRAAHRKLARWTFPIWIYVSITGVLVYVALYWLYPVANPA